MNGKGVGSRIGNNDVLAKLGSGGTGTVFRARHGRMQRVVALKLLARKLCKDANLLQRFRRDVEAIAYFSHPNIVMAHETEEAPAGQFLVPELVTSQDL